MKKFVLSIAVVAISMAVALNVFAQQGQNRFRNLSDEERAQMRERFQNMSEEERAQFRQRFSGRSRISREDQLKAVEAVEEELSKLKDGIESQPAQGGTNFRDLSEEERTKLREQFTKSREARQTAITAIKAEIDKLSPPWATPEQIAAIDELREIRVLAEKEKAVETTKRLASYIEKQMEQMPPMRGRGRQGTRAGGPRINSGSSSENQ